jgi:hypothetical protein
MVEFVCIDALGVAMPVAGLNIEVVMPLMRGRPNIRKHTHLLELVKPKSLVPVENLSTRRVPSRKFLSVRISNLHGQLPIICLVLRILSIRE